MQFSRHSSLPLLILACLSTRAFSFSHCAFSAPLLSSSIATTARPLLSSSFLATSPSLRCSIARSFFLPGLLLSHSQRRGVHPSTYSQRMAESSSSPGTASSSSSPAAAPNAPLFSFGIIADVQYADADDGSDFAKTVVRRYRQSLSLLRKAVSGWNARQDLSLSFIAQLGDLIDGCNKKLGASEGALAACLAALDQSRCKEVHHLIGNHELYNFDRETLAKLLNTKRGRGGESYYSFQPATGWRVLVLDAYDIAAIGATGPNLQIAERWLEENNPNDLKQPGVNWREGLSGLECRWMPYNGGIGTRQLAWLDTQLQEAQQQSQRAVILSHVSLLPRSPAESCLLWNYQQVLSVCRSSSALCLVLAGHAHRGGYVQDEFGVHHVTVQSPLECDAGESASAVAHVFPDRVELEGEGRVPSRSLSLPPLPPPLPPSQPAPSGSSPSMPTPAPPA